MTSGNMTFLVAKALGDALFNTDFSVSMQDLKFPVTSTRENGAAWDTEIGVDQRIRMLWTSRGSLELENVLSTGLLPDAETRLASELAWKRPGSPDALGGLPLPPLFTELERTLEHVSRIELDFRSQVHTSVFARIRHESVVRFAESGSIRVHGAIGLGTERSEDSRPVMLGVQLGIEGRLRL